MKEIEEIIRAKSKEFPAFKKLGQEKKEVAAGYILCLRFWAAAHNQRMFLDIKIKTFIKSFIRREGSLTEGELDFYNNFARNTGMKEIDLIDNININFLLKDISLGRDKK